MDTDVHTTMYRVGDNMQVYLVPLKCKKYSCYSEMLTENVKFPNIFYITLIVLYSFDIADRQRCIWV